MTYKPPGVTIVDSGKVPASQLPSSVMKFMVTSLKEAATILRGFGGPIWAVKEDTMRVRVVNSMAEAKEFYEAPDPADNAMVARKNMVTVDRNHVATLMEALMFARMTLDHALDLGHLGEGSTQGMAKEAVDKITAALGDGDGYNL